MVKLKKSRKFKIQQKIKLWSKFTGRACVPCVPLRAPLTARTLYNYKPLLSGSVAQPQDMLYLCTIHAKELDIKFNAQKTCLLDVGRSVSENIDNLHFGGYMVNWSARSHEISWNVYHC